MAVGLTADVHVGCQCPPLPPNTSSDLLAHNGSDVAPRSAVIASDVLDVGWLTTLKVLEILIQSRKPPTRKTYSSKWKTFPYGQLKTI